MYGPFMIGLNYFNPNIAEKKLLASPMTAGVVLMERNYQCYAQVKELIAKMQSLRKSHQLPPLLIAIDHEGGYIQRLRGTKFTTLPTAQQVGDFFCKDFHKGSLLIKAIAKVMAYELGSLGIDLVMGPVLDINTHTNYARNNSRSYSSDAKVIYEITALLIEEIQKEGLTCIAKHFPGTGAIGSDPHHIVSISKQSKENLQYDLYPYRELCKKQNLKALMLSHLIYLKVDHKPIAISSYWINHILRQEIGYEGAIFTDCLQMLGACLTGQNLKEKVLNALRAGCDLTLVTQVDHGYYTELYEIFQEREINDFTHSSKARQSRIKSLHLAYSIDYYEKQLLSQEYLSAQALIEEYWETGIFFQPASAPYRLGFNHSFIYKRMKHFAKKTKLKKMTNQALKIFYTTKLKLLNLFYVPRRK
jgi:beta-N-acetylhexosaminidase